MEESEQQKIVHVHLPTDKRFETTLTAGDHELKADEPETVEGGTNLGPDPYDLLLMSLGSCTAMTIKMYAQRKNWPLEDVYVELRHRKSHIEDCKTCEESSSKMDSIEKEIILKGELSQDQKEKLLDISKKCPVHRTLLSSIDIVSMLE